jgi:hypothetical protein
MKRVAPEKWASRRRRKSVLLILATSLIIVTVAHLQQLPAIIPSSTTEVIHDQLRTTGTRLSPSSQHDELKQQPQAKRTLQSSPFDEAFLHRLIQDPPLIEKATTTMEVFVVNDTNIELVPEQQLDSSMHWCKIMENGAQDPPRWLDNISHTLELLARCWAWFYANRATNQCGFVFATFAYRKLLESKVYTWQRELLQAMGCKVIYYDTSNVAALLSLQHTHSPMDYIHYRGNERFQEDVQWFYNLSGAAPALRSRVLEYYNAAMTRKQPRYQVNIIQRKGSSRQLLDLDSILQQLRQRYPTNTSVKIHEWNTRGNVKTLAQQAYLFATSDLFVAAHGAALTNAFFLKPGAALLEIYPHGYIKPRFFRPLVLAAGARHYSYYDDGKEACRDAKEHAEDWELQRNINISISNASLFLDLVDRAVRGDDSMSNDWFENCAY